MPNDFKQLRLRQVDDKLEPWSDLRDVPPPRSGWIREIREALGMTNAQLAARMGMSQQAVSDLEQREMKRTATLGALDAAASALDAEVVYAIVPKCSLAEMLQNQAAVRAAELLGWAEHTMSLEAQDLPDSERDMQRAETARSLLQEWPRSLWDSSETTGEAR